MPSAAAFLDDSSAATAGSATAFLDAPLTEQEQEKKKRPSASEFLGPDEPPGPGVVQQVRDWAGNFDHRLLNNVRKAGSGLGKYIFEGMEALGLEQAKILANPPPEVTAPQAEEVLLSPEKQAAGVAHRTAAASEQVQPALDTAAYWWKRAAEVEAESKVDPKLEGNWDTRISGALGPALGMVGESLIPAVGLPLMAVHGALAAEAQAKNAGKSEEDSETTAVRSLIGLAIFGGVAKTAALGVAKLLPAGSKTLTKFVAQFLGQDAANETSSRAIAAWEAAADAKPGEKLAEATKALTNTTLESTTLNAVFAGIGASSAVGKGGKKSETPTITQEVQRDVPPEFTSETATISAVPRESAFVVPETTIERANKIPISDPSTAALPPESSQSAPMGRIPQRETTIAGAEGKLIKSFADLPPDLPVVVNPVAVAAANAEGLRAIIGAPEPPRVSMRPAEPRLTSIPEHLRPDFEVSRLTDEGSIEKTAPKLKLKADRHEGGFVNPEIFQEVVDFGTRLYQKGMDYAIWAKQMVRHLGQRVGQVLQRVWDSLIGANFLPNSRQGGGFGFGGGKTKATPLGATPRGDKEFIRIPKPLGRALHGLEREGAGDVIGRSRNKVAKLLSKATRRHVDTEQELFGDVYTKLAKPVQGENRAAVNAAFEELKPYIAAKENKRPLPSISPRARKILNAWEDVAEFTGDLAAAHNVQVFDPVLGESRPMRQIGRSYIPRMFRPEVQQVMSEPNRNPKLWNDLVNELALHRGIPVDDAANQLRAEAGRFQANDFMGNLEMARTAQLPAKFYEYDLRQLITRYTPAFSERMAQIISYGQRLGPRDAPQRPNLWDIARSESADTYTQEWLREAEDQAVNLRASNSFDRNAARVQTLASGLLLSSPTTSVLRNTFSGLTSTAELLGTFRSVGTLVDAATRSQTRMDAREIGAVRDNIADFLHADKLGESPIDDAVRWVADKFLKYSGYNGSEVFVRSHAALTASQFAMDGVAAIRRNPGSHRAKEALALFKRMGVDAEAIVNEGADWKTGAESRKFIRTVIRESQGGYRFDQVPLWANSNTGRFFYQFGRWGTQRARNIWRNGVMPALGETVTYKGKTMTRWDPLPLMKMAAGSVLLGEVFGLVASAFFDRDRRDASLSEIGHAWKEDEKKAIGLALERAVNDIIMSGTMGIWSQPIDFAKSLKDQSRLRDPSQPPSLTSVKAFIELARRGMDQGGRLTKRDLLDFARQLAPGATQLWDVERNIVNDPLYEAQNDMRTLRNAGRRWAKVQGLDVSSPTRGDTFRKSPMAPEYEPIKEALLVGDAKQARARATKLWLAADPKSRTENPGKVIENLRSSIQQSQPFRVGPYTAATHYNNFRAWAERHLSPEDYNQIVRVQRKYVITARQAGLW